jgi:hypothetical protein
MNPEGERIVWDRKLFWKISKWIGIVLLIAYLFLVLVANLGPSFGQYLNKKSQEIYINKLKKESARIEALERADTYGGKTPEETLDLYIEALKKGDLESAIKYIRVDQQERSLKELKSVELETGNLKYAISYAVDVRNFGKKTCTKDGCIMEYVYINKKEQAVNLGESGDTLLIPEGNKRKKIFNFELNSYAQIWKIVRP